MRLTVMDGARPGTRCDSFLTRGMYVPRVRRRRGTCRESRRPYKTHTNAAAPWLRWTRGRSHPTPRRRASDRREELRHALPHCLVRQTSDTRAHVVAEMLRIPGRGN